MKKIISKILNIFLTLAVGLSPLLLTAKPVLATGLYEYNGSYHHMNSFGYTPQDYYAQSFSPTSTHILTGVSLYMTRYDVPTNSTFFRLETNYAGNNTPSGTILGTGSMSNTVLTDSNAWCPTVSISGSNVVTANETYWIIWWTGDRIDWLKCPKYASSDPSADAYTRGLVGTWHTGDGGYWTSAANGDADFKEYGTDAPTPPAVTTVGATAETYVGATLTGNLTSMGGAETVRTEIFYGLTAPAYGYYEVANFDQNATGEFSVVVTDMPANTTIHYQAHAVGRVGGVDVSVANGADMTFNTTVNPVAPPIIATFPANQITNTTACLMGKLTGFGDYDNVTFSFQYGLTPGDYTTPTPAIPPYLLDTDPLYTIVGFYYFALPLGAIYGNSDLVENTTYYYRAIANYSSDPVYGANLTFTTLSDASFIPTVLETLPATDITNTTTTLNANLTYGGFAGPLACYFSLGPSPSFGSFYVAATNVTSSQSFSYNVTGLNPGTTYYYLPSIPIAPFAGNEVMTFTTTGTPSATPTSYLGVLTNEGQVQTIGGIVRYVMKGTLTGTGGSQATVYFQYGPTTAYGSFNSAGINTLKYSSYTQFSDTTFPLTNGEYHYRAVAYNSTIQVFGQDKTFIIGSSTGTPTPPTPTPTPVPSVIDLLADLLGADLTTAGGQWFVILVLMVVIPVLLIIFLHRYLLIATILSVACDVFVLGWAIITWLNPILIAVILLVAAGVIVIFIWLGLGRGG